jgi:addiction module HigA family antidote
MLTTKRRPASGGEILTEEFMAPMGLAQGALAEAMGVQRKHVNELCNNRCNVTAAAAAKSPVVGLRRSVLKWRSQGDSNPGSRRDGANYALLQCPPLSIKMAKILGLSMVSSTSVRYNSRS